MSWTLQQIYDDLGTLEDVAEALDVTPRRVRAWIERRERVNSPVPVKKLKMLNLYSIEEWRGWFARWSTTRGYEAKERPTGRFPRPEAAPQLDSH